MACVQLNDFWDTLSTAFLRYFLPASSPVAHLAVVEYGDYLLKVHTSYVIAYIKHASISLKVLWSAQNCTFPVASTPWLKLLLERLLQGIAWEYFRWTYSSMWKAQSETKYMLTFLNINIKAFRNKAVTSTFVSLSKGSWYIYVYWWWGSANIVIYRTVQAVIRKTVPYLVWRIAL